jgi:electron transport complex protein RnfB
MSNESKVYRDLQKHMNTLPVGFPATQSGVEIRILKHFFTPEEARVATCLTINPEPITRIYERIKKTGISLEKLQVMLDNMECKVCIKTSTKGGKKYYSNQLFAYGLAETLVNHLTPELLQNTGQYMPDFDREMFRTKISYQMRTIPVEKSIPLPEKYQVASYDSIRKLIDNNTGQLAVANCICRQTGDLKGVSCKITDLRETCLLLDGEQYINAGLGRPITREEAFDILKKAQEAGLVLQPGNSQQPVFVCCCCGDCCGILKNIKQLPRPADFYNSNFYAEIDPELCTGCHICIERCQLGAPFMNNGVAVINLDRCIGCGNCVIVCEAKAVHLKKKESVTVPPKNVGELYQQILVQKTGK